MILIHSLSLDNVHQSQRENAGENPSESAHGKAKKKKKNKKEKENDVILNIDRNLLTPNSTTSIGKNEVAAAQDEGKGKKISAQRTSNADMIAANSLMTNSPPRHSKFSFSQSIMKMRIISTH